MVSEIAQRTGEGLMSFPSSCRSLRKAGVVINPRIRLFEIVLQYFADKSNRTLDFGHCLLRMNPCGKWQ